MGHGGAGQGGGGGGAFMVSNKARAELHAAPLCFSPRPLHRGRDEEILLPDHDLSSFLAFALISPLQEFHLAKASQSERFRVGTSGIHGALTTRHRPLLFPFSSSGLRPQPTERSSSCHDHSR